MPACFVDLNLDQVIDEAVARRDPSPRAVFYRPLPTVKEIEYRQDVFRDIEELGFAEGLRAFSKGITASLRLAASAASIRGPYHRMASHLEAALEYRTAVEDLSRLLGAKPCSSRALVGLARYLEGYAASEVYAGFAQEAQGIKEGLSALSLVMSVKGVNVSIREACGEADYGAELEACFERFGSGGGARYLVGFPELRAIDRVQEKALACVAKLSPALFARLARFARDHADFADETLVSCAAELEFYLSWLDYIADIRASGLAFCLPAVSEGKDGIDARGIFDVALAKKAALTSCRVVVNDLRLEGPERLLVISGPNQGGKTTFARAVGQAHYLASLGCPVQGSSARLFLCDAIHTLFEREEGVSCGRGKLHDELVAFRAILSKATERSLVILNEAFSATGLGDAKFLLEEALQRLEGIDPLCVCVTFIEEVAAPGSRAVSMVCGVDPLDPAIRTFKLERRAPDGLAYARSLAEKHRLTYELLRERLRA